MEVQTHDWKKDSFISELSTDGRLLLLVIRPTSALVVAGMPPAPEPAPTPPDVFYAAMRIKTHSFL